MDIEDPELTRKVPRQAQTQNPDISTMHCPTLLGQVDPVVAASSIHLLGFGPAVVVNSSFSARSLSSWVLILIPSLLVISFSIDPQLSHPQSKSCPYLPHYPLISRYLTSPLL